MEYEVYIAGPLFNPEENRHNKLLAKMFRTAGYTVFNPVEDGIEGAAVENLSEEELIRKIHQLDFNRVMGSRIFVANLNGPQIDDGTATEIGMAYVSKVGIPGQGNPGNVELMIGYLSDTRSITYNMRRNPLPYGSFDKVFDNRNAILEYALQKCPPRNL